MADKLQIPYDVQFAGPEVIAHFLSMVQAGESPRFAEMLALQKAPAANTDREFFSGRNTLGQQFDGDDRGLATVLRAAKRHGFTPSRNDIYEPGLCRPEVGQGDPQAFISSSDGRGEVKRRVERLGWAADGLVKSKGGMSREKEGNPLAKKLAANLLPKAINKTPELARASKSEQYAELVRRHGRHKKGL